MELGRQRANRTRELGVRPQLLSLGREVMVGLGAVKLCLAVLADHDERRQEDRLERDDEGQPRPWIRFDEEHPAGEGDDVDVHKRHGARERSDRIGDAKLHVLRSSARMFGDDRMVQLWPSGDRRSTWRSQFAPSPPEISVSTPPALVADGGGAPECGSGLRRASSQLTACPGCGALMCVCLVSLVRLATDRPCKPKLEGAEEEHEPADRPGDADRSGAGVDDEEDAQQHQEDAAESDRPRACNLLARQIANAIRSRPRAATRSR